jgi:hypothetical protein
LFIFTALGTNVSNITTASTWRVTYANGTTTDAFPPFYSPVTDYSLPFNMTVSFTTNSLHNALFKARAWNCPSIQTSGVLSRGFRLCNLNESVLPTVISQISPSFLVPLESLGNVTLTATASSMFVCGVVVFFSSLSFPKRFYSFVHLFRFLVVRSRDLLEWSRFRYLGCGSDKSHSHFQFCNGCGHFDFSCYSVL